MPPSDDADTRPLAPSLSAGAEAADTRPPPKPPVGALDVEATRAGRANKATLDRRIDAALLPCLCAVSVSNYLDRTNLAFAAVGLRRDLGLSLAQYGLGSSLLFATYCLAQLPIAMLGARVGLTRTLAAACALWGVVAASMSAITTPAHFYAARLALGLAEAPTFPLIVTYLRSFHASDGAVGASYAYVHAATLVASVVGGPLAAAILSMDGVAGWAGWRWLLLLEGVPPLGVALWILAALPPSPAAAKFLTPDERATLAADVAAARGGGRGAAAASPPPAAALVATLRNWRLVVVGAVEMVSSSGRFAAMFFTPLIIDEILGDAHRDRGAPQPAKNVALAALLSAIPFGLAAAASVVNAAAAKRAAAARGTSRKWFIVWPTAVCAAGLWAFGPLVARAASPAAAAAAFVAVVAGLLGFSAYGVIMSVPSSLTPHDALSSALAYGLFTALAMAGGLIGPALLGATTQATGGSYTLGGGVLGCFSAGAGLFFALWYGWVVPGGK